MFLSYQITGDKKNGFTLVELIVSMALFIVVVFIVTSTFLTVTNLYKKARTTRTALDNLSVALESMTREIRTGTLYHCGVGVSDLSDIYNVFDLEDYLTANGGNIPPQDCRGVGAPRIAFMSSDDGATMYRFCVGEECDSNTYGSIKRIKTNLVETAQMTGSDINIDALMFYVGGTSPNSPQPHVIIVIKGTAGTDPKTSTPFSIYTSVTQRALQ